MPTEQSFADRLNRGRQLHSTIAAFQPDFDPADVILSPDEFDGFLSQLDSLNMETAGALYDYSALAEEREEVASEVKRRVLRVSHFVESAGSWKMQEGRLLSLKNKIRGNRLSKPTPPEADEEEEGATVKRRRQGEQSYADIENNLDAFVDALKKLDNYAPPAEELRADLPEGEDIPPAIAALPEGRPKREAIRALSMKHLAESLEWLNKSLNGLETAVKQKQGKRRTAYDGEAGLKERKKAIKKAVSAQYGTDSPEYLLARSIRV